MNISTLSRILHLPISIQETKILNLNRVNQLIFVLVKYGVLFEVRTEFLNIYSDKLRLQRVNVISRYESTSLYW
jgi:hypothetical protein